MHYGKMMVLHPPAELRERVDGYCKETGIYMTELMRRAIDEYLAPREAEIAAKKARTGGGRAGGRPR